MCLLCFEHAFEELVMAFGLPVQRIQTLLCGVPAYCMPSHLNYGHVAGRCMKKNTQKNIFLAPHKFAANLGKGNMMHIPSVGLVALAALSSCAIIPKHEPPAVDV